MMDMRTGVIVIKLNFFKKLKNDLVSKCFVRHYINVVTIYCWKFYVLLRTLNMIIIEK